ncbi:hypothetical protein GPALN_013285 [Globodera pallida]|nr:hypothetical protein GPALN_013285 [Globodera pallida]
MENYWASLLNFRAKQVAELEAENEWLRERSILHEDIVNEIKECLIEGRKDRRQLEEAEEELKSLKSDRNFSTDQNEQLGEKSSTNNRKSQTTMI